MAVQSSELYVCQYKKVNCKFVSTEHITVSLSVQNILGYVCQYRPDTGNMAVQKSAQFVYHLRIEYCKLISKEQCTVIF